MSEYRGHKQHEIEDIGDIVDLDHISNLPDYILHQILSFMPTKEAVKTSILSTRWKNLWVSVPTIDFDDELLMAKLADGWLRPDVTSFVNFVERVLRLHDASNMEKFRLSCCVYRNAFQISSWISDAIIHNVQELDMSLFAKDPSVIPQSMFHNTSLVSLKIRMNCAIQLPSHVSFPCLKTLHMSFVRFMHDDFTEKLFSGCPALEELSLSDCRWINLKSIAISSSTLKSLSIRDLTHFVVFDDPTSGCKIKIDAANLTYFGYFGNLLNEIIFNDTMSLDKAFIKFPNPGEGVNKVACRAIDLFQQLKYVVSLTLSNHTMEGFMCDMHLGENNSTWSSMPICITNCLKTVTLKNFHGYNSEICFLKRILKTACALEMMDIWWSKTKTYLRDLKKKIEVRKELEKIERKAAACVIKLS
ncbi:F-box/LRR-repeat protein At3g58900 [Lactuca sativa]|uniref:F-box domain-containing protein n=1 Tax=Lactuca sativa TaxID=4236 RepID=A0A9R1X1D7_LACSA|nr:F-box/LRR-repeat protein At3g58900 [Lactuca sativa]KAJ0194694.1 hypothetical protein LSAT_V11C700384830 [Lactuca sativa]